MNPAPITPMKDGQPPGFVVSCLECTYAHDVHAETAEAAAAEIVARHANGKHRMTANPTRYHEPIWGRDKNIRHPMYFPGG